MHDTLTLAPRVQPWSKNTLPTTMPLTMLIVKDVTSPRTQHKIPCRRSDWMLQCLSERGCAPLLWKHGSIPGIEELGFSRSGFVIP